MARNYRKPRSPIGTSGKFGRLIPFYRGLACPGETLQDLKCVTNLSTLPTEFSMAGATFDVWFYKVPIRLLWDEFPEWIMGGAGTYPRTAGSADARFLQNTDRVHFYTDAYQMIVNHFFRTDEEQEYNYTVGGNLAAMPVVDITAEHKGSQDYENEDVTIDVSGGTLSMAELAKKRAEFKYERSVEAMDGKYGSYLRNQGVRVDEQLEGVPEFLGHGRRFIKPRKTVDQSDGFTKQNYSLEFDLRLSKKRYIQEHSLVIGVASLRPKVHLINKQSWEIFLDSPEKWPHKQQLPEHKLLETDFTGATYAGVGNELVTMDDILWSGEHQVVSVARDIKTHDPISAHDAKFPVSAWDSFVANATPLGGDHFVIEGFCATGFATPLRRTKVA